ncbi:MAG: 3-hydroxyacyl-[acyl-carrier-protein] dehydratase FabZ [Candidatus Tokpelaia sp.]|uniref:3-hydroxyacyl-ACP dehydratase FabZ n=1 Tax=Candidatus Tokpelaia sp. TaxID=2233777 RepID=UPI00123C02A4|nr:3-hydroxyacyl-ACP dehydratase FabZ [Candidatus Tokpelaia sp.]KAA6205880.1 MAG: 3-hydroxyacyl-[acyl-carrier-protein] dehydratase FabZ [Candidatus Tokpelaia sp.]KAA6207730.1 MAG: 3-hydroxyacyl-[acyl-carrier-protein] dehydratase FabZ [Candidatus Tokpelaia sp.]KAA6404904.1 3-hydroxyacyl-[acyl-carrier-protein] dehydratase FabZ [Candidatus Tokpelaia sp.]
MKKEEKRQLETADIMQITRLLPHRYPFLLVDKIIAIDGDNSATGIKNVTLNEPHFTGHFPESPIMPGVLIIEAMAQTAGAICLLQREKNGCRPAAGKKHSVYFMTIDNAKFRRPVIPGDQLHIHVTKIKGRDKVFRFGCVAEVDGEKAAEAEVTAMIDEIGFAG